MIEFKLEFQPKYRALVAPVELPKDPPAFLLFPFPAWWTSPLLKLPADRVEQINAWERARAAKKAITDSQRQANERRNEGARNVVYSPQRS